jgi:hypothetical protein
MRLNPPLPNPLESDPPLHAEYFPDAPPEPTEIPMQFEHIQSSIKANISWLDKMLWIGLTLSLIIVLLRISGHPEFAWLGVKFKTSYAFVIFGILSIVHFYVTVILLNTIRVSWRWCSTKQRLDIFFEVVSTSGPFIRGMTERSQRMYGSSRLWGYTMAPDDPSVWVSLLAVILAFFALLPFRLTPVLPLLTKLVCVFLLIGFNWVIGTNWAVALSELSIERKTSLFFGRVKSWRDTYKVRKMGPIIFSGSSGPPTAEVPYFLAPLYWLSIRLVDVGLILLLLCIIGFEWIRNRFR